MSKDVQLILTFKMVQKELNKREKKDHIDWCLLKIILIDCSFIEPMLHLICYKRREDTKIKSDWKKLTL